MSQRQANASSNKPRLLFMEFNPTAILCRLRQLTHKLLPWCFISAHTEPTIVEDVRKRLLSTYICGHAPRLSRRPNTYFLCAKDHQEVYFWSKSLARGSIVQKQRAIHGVSYFTFRLTEGATLRVKCRDTDTKHFATGVISFTKAKALFIRILFLKPA